MKSVFGQEPSRMFRRHEHLAQGDEVQNTIYRLQSGWACRYQILPDGRRQIAGLFLPGDYCEPQWLLTGRSQLPVVALTQIVATEHPIGTLRSVSEDRFGKVLNALITNFNRQTEWIVSLGRMSASARISALFSELHARMSQDGHVPSPCALPLTQQDIADIVGLTPVHVNRVLKELRKHGLVEFRGRTVVVPNPAPAQSVEAARAW